MSVFNEADEEALENELNKGALWAITYGDLMSYLFIFFLIMFVFAATKDVATQFSLTAVQQQFGAKKTNVDAATVMFSKEGIQQIAKVDVQQDRIRLSFQAPILYDEGFAEIKPQSIPHLKRLALALKDLPNPIVIEGHTDSLRVGKRLQKLSGIETNWELSSARAFSVLRFLIEEGIPPGRLSYAGYGEFRPIAPNDTPEGRAANRRIEINIMRQQD